MAPRAGNALTGQRIRALADNLDKVWPDVTGRPGPMPEAAKEVALAQAAAEMTGSGAAAQRPIVPRSRGSRDRIPSRPARSARWAETMAALRPDLADSPDLVASICLQALVYLPDDAPFPPGGQFELLDGDAAAS
jgi:hypothetical protein